MPRLVNATIPIALAFAIILVVAPTVLLLVFAGILVGVLLHGGGAAVAERLGLDERVGLLVFCVGLVGSLALFGLVAAPFLAEQFDELWRKIPEAAENFSQRLERYSLTREVLETVDAKDLATSAGQRSGTAINVVFATLVSLGNAVIVIFLGIYLAISPRLYMRGFAALFPPRHRPRIIAMLSETGVALWGFMTAQFISMAVVGVLTWLGLWFLGVPLAPVLGVVAGLFAFIPNLGPILGTAPAALLALMQGPSVALQVIGLTLLVQTIESYLITPTVQRETVDLPPAVTIAAQLLMGVLYGTLGLALATPLAAALLRVLRIFYVKDHLEREEARLPG